MCQLRVRLLGADGQEHHLEEVTHIAVEPDKIILTPMFEPPRELIGFQITEIDCLRNSVFLTWQADK